MPTGGGVRRRKKERRAAFSPKRQRRQHPDAPRLHIVPIPSYSTPVPPRPRPTRAARAAASACIELDSDPISTALFSTPRPRTAKRRANTAFNVPSAKKTKVVRVRKPPPGVSLSEPSIQDSPRELGVVVPHPAHLVPTCASVERAENADGAQAKDRHADERADAHNAQELGSRSLKDLENLARRIAEPKEADVTAAAAAATSSAALPAKGDLRAPEGLVLSENLTPAPLPPDKSSPAQVSMEASGDEAPSEVGPSQIPRTPPRNSPSKPPASQLAVEALDAEVPSGLVVSQRRPNCSQSESPGIDLASEPGVASQPTAEVPAREVCSPEADVGGGENEMRAAPACSPPVRPPKFSLSPTPSPFSPRELGVLAAHLPPVVLTCATEEFADDSDAEAEHVLSAKRADNVYSERQPEPEDLSEHLDAVGGDEVSRPAEPEVPAVAPVQFSESQPEPGDLSEHLDAAGDDEVAAPAGPQTPAAAAAVSPLNADKPECLPASTPVAAHCGPRRDSGRDPKNRVLVPETPSEERRSPALVDETPPSELSPAPVSNERTPHRLSGSTVTPAVSSARGVVARRSRQTPPLFAGFTPGPAGASAAASAAVQQNQRGRSRRVSWSDRRGSFPRCAQTPPDFGISPGPAPASSPAVVLGTALKRAQTPCKVPVQLSCDLFSESESGSGDSPEKVPVVPPRSVPRTEPPARNPRVTDSAVDDSRREPSAQSSPAEDSLSDCVLVPETCVQETQAADPVCRRALEFVNARVARMARGECVAESDSSTEPPPQEEIAERWRFCPALDGEQVRSGPRPAGFRECVPSGALAASSGSEMGDDEDD